MRYQVQNKMKYSDSEINSFKNKNMNEIIIIFCYFFEIKNSE